MVIRAPADILDPQIRGACSAREEFGGEEEHFLGEDVLCAHFGRGVGGLEGCDERVWWGGCAVGSAVPGCVEGVKVSLGLGGGLGGWSARGGGAGWGGAGFGRSGYVLCA